MRCKCCDKLNAKWWNEDFYCNECRNVIHSTIVEDQDDFRKNTSENFSEEIETVHIRWDEE